MAGPNSSYTPFQLHIRNGTYFGSAFEAASRDMHLISKFHGRLVSLPFEISCSFFRLTLFTVASILPTELIGTSNRPHVMSMSEEKREIAQNPKNRLE